MRSTHTYVELGLSQPAYDEIAQKLRAAGYDHAFDESGAIDLHGLAAVLDPAAEPRTTVTIDAQPTLEGVEPVSDADNQWFGDMMILQVLADSDKVNDQEREVLLRWMTASKRPGAAASAEPSLKDIDDFYDVLRKVGGAAVDSARGMEGKTT